MPLAALVLAVVLAVFGMAAVLVLVLLLALLAAAGALVLLLCMLPLLPQHLYRLLNVRHGGALQRLAWSACGSACVGSTKHTALHNTQAYTSFSRCAGAKAPVVHRRVSTHPYALGLAHMCVYACTHLTKSSTRIIATQEVGEVQSQRCRSSHKDILREGDREEGERNNWARGTWTATANQAALRR